jgi:membrane protein YdbS with pleckstrin-like domain
VNDPEATKIARMQARALDFNGNTDLEETVFTVRPTMLFVKAGYALAVVAGLALVFFLAWLGVPAWISILLALAILLIPAYYHVRRNMIKYTVTDSKLQIDTGLIGRTTKNIPLSKVQDVTVSASIPQRLMGFGDIIIDNASELGGSIVMHNISSPRHYADLLLRELRRWH